MAVSGDVDPAIWVMLLMFWRKLLAPPSGQKNVISTYEKTKNFTGKNS